MRLRIALCLLILGIASVAHATTFYVAASGGSDGRSCGTAQTITTPKLTIVSGMTCLSAGDTLYIRQGTYGENIDSNAQTIPSGTSWSNAVTIAGYPGETVTINGTNRFESINITLSESYIIFKNLRILGLSIQGSTHHIRFTDGDIDGTLRASAAPDTVLMQIRTSSNEFLNSKLHDAGYVDGIVAPCSNQILYRCYGSYLLGDHTLFEGNVVYNNAGYGINLYNSGSSTVSDNIIRNNIFYGNGFYDYKSGFSMSAVLMSSGSNNQLYNNVIYGNCHGVEMYETNGGTNNQIYNNTIYNNGTSATGTCQTPQPGITLYASTIDTDIKNNIIYNNGLPFVDWGSTNPTFGYNLCESSTTECNTGNNSVIGNPSFVNTGSNNFHLQSGSPAINAGTTLGAVPKDFDGVTRPQGSAYDIGAFEFNSGTGSPLVAWYQFNSGSGNTASDSSGIGNTGALTGTTLPAWVTGIEGSALNFDGVTSSVDVPNSTSLQLASTFTLAAYVNPSAANVDFRAVVVKNYTYYLYATSTGICGNGAIVAGFTQGVNRNVCYATPLPVNTWTHVAVTYDGTTLTLYVGGSAVATTSVSGAIDVSSGTLQIGANQYGENFAGKLDDVRVYNAALTATEVLALVIPPPVATHVAFTTQPTNAVAGVSISPSIVVQLQDATNTNVATSGVAIVLTLHAGNTGTLSGTLSQNTGAGGAATFANLSINLAGTKSLDASSSTYTGATSSSFVISAAAASKLVFAQQPSNALTTVAIAPPITVQIQDQFGNLTTSTASVAVVIGTNPSSGTLSGTTPKTAVSGVATFSNLSINLAGVGYTLVMSSGGLTSATSVGFTITSTGGATRVVLPGRRTGLFATP